MFESSTGIRATGIIGMTSDLYDIEKQSTSSNNNNNNINRIGESFLVVFYAEISSLYKIIESVYKIMNPTHDIQSEPCHG